MYLISDNMAELDGVPGWILLASRIDAESYKTLDALSRVETNHKGLSGHKFKSNDKLEKV